MKRYLIECVQINTVLQYVCNSTIAFMLRRNYFKHTTVYTHKAFRERLCKLIVIKVKKKTRKYDLRIHNSEIWVEETYRGLKYINKFDTIAK
jgi:hypothetical protein